MHRDLRSSTPAVRATSGAPPSPRGLRSAHRSSGRSTWRWHAARGRVDTWSSTASHSWRSTSAGWAYGMKTFYDDLAFRYGFEAEAATVQDLYLSDRKEEAAAAVPQEPLQATSLIGSVEQVKDKLAEFTDAGATTLNLHTVHTPNGCGASSWSEVLRRDRRQDMSHTPRRGSRARGKTSTNMSGPASGATGVGARQHRSRPACCDAARRPRRRRRARGPAAGPGPVRRGRS